MKPMWYDYLEPSNNTHDLRANKLWRNIFLIINCHWSAISFAQHEPIAIFLYCQTQWLQKEYLSIIYTTPGANILDLLRHCTRSVAFSFSARGFAEPICSIASIQSYSLSYKRWKIDTELPLRFYSSSRLQLWEKL